MPDNCPPQPPNRRLIQLPDGRWAMQTPNQPSLDELRDIVDAVQKKNDGIAQAKKRLESRAQARRRRDKKRQEARRKLQDAPGQAPFKVIGPYDPNADAFPTQSVSGRQFNGIPITNGAIRIGDTVRGMWDGKSSFGLIDAMPKGKDIVIPMLSPTITKKEPVTGNLYLLYSYLNSVANKVEFWLGGYVEEPIKIWEVDNYYVPETGINLWDHMSNNYPGHAGITVKKDRTWAVRFDLPLEAGDTGQQRKFIYIDQDGPVIQAMQEWFPPFGVPDSSWYHDPVGFAFGQPYFNGSLYQIGSVKYASGGNPQTERIYTFFDKDTIESVDFIRLDGSTTFKQYVFPDYLFSIENAVGELNMGDLSYVYAIDSDRSAIAYKQLALHRKEAGNTVLYNLGYMTYGPNHESVAPTNYVSAVDSNFVYGLATLTFEYAIPDPFGGITFGPIVRAYPNKYYFHNDWATVSYHDENQYVIRLNELISGAYSYSNKEIHDSMTSGTEGPDVDVTFYDSRHLPMLANSNYYTPASLGVDAPWKFSGELYKVYSGEKYELSIMKHRFEPNPDTEGWGQIVQEELLTVDVFPFVFGDRILEKTRLLACGYVPSSDTN